MTVELPVADDARDVASLDGGHQRRVPGAVYARLQDGDVVVDERVDQLAPARRDQRLGVLALGVSRLARSGGGSSEIRA
jgi:hypothetical protein